MDVTVELDGIAIGSAPGSFQGFPGLHKLRLSREGFDSWERTVNLYDGQNLIGETTNSVPTYYLYGPGIDEPLAVYVTSGTTSGFHYFDVDGLGSVVATNNPSGTIEHNAVFDAWGTTRSETGTRFHPFSYTGREVGEAGLLYYRARYLQPGVGRFTQEDPLRGATRRHYTYAANSPMAFTDPNGLAEHCTLSSHMLSCLQQIFTADAADIANVEVISTPKSGGKWFATTRPNLIIAYVPCNEFFAQHESVLEEYYHVLRQWKTGEMTLLGWLWETAKHGYEGNKFEIEAKAFASAALPIFDKCLSCSGVDR